jgi:polyhydroxyalkanoate synthase
MGICMGGTFCTIYSAFHPEKVKNLVLTVTPSSFDTREGLLHVWMNELDVDKVVDGFGNIPGDIMNFGFLLLNPARLMIDKYKGFFTNVDNKPFVENFVRMERWIYDSPDFPGETFRQFIKDMYQKNLLIKNELVVGGQKVDLKKVTMPVLNIYAKFDHLVPPSASDKLTKVLGSKDTEDLCLETGHIGIYVSSKYQKEFAPKISGWLLERDEEKKTKPSTKPGKTSGKKEENEAA